MNLKERFLNRLQGKEVDLIPVGCTTTYGVVDIMNECGFHRPLADMDPLAMTELAYAGFSFGGFEWVKAMGWDIVALSEALGCRLGEPSIDRAYHVDWSPFAENLHNLSFPSDFLERGRFPVFREHFRLLREKIGGTMAIFGETEGAFTCAANLMGVQRFIKGCLKDSSAVEEVLEVARQAAVAAANFAFDNGADYYVFAEPTSGPAMLGPRLYEKLVFPLEKEIIAAIEGPVVLHVCSNTDSIVDMMCETGASGISIEEKTDLKRAVTIAHAKGIKVFGNVATSTTLVKGKPDDVYREAIAALENGTDFLCPGCGIAPRSPLENILQLKKARDDFFHVLGITEKSSAGEN